MVIRTAARSSTVPPAVAAAHPSTAAAGAAVLRRGGGAVDAGVAMILVSCAAETLFTGLSGGGFATIYEAATGTVRCVDFFVDVPRDNRGTTAPIEVFLGGYPVPYDIGPGTVAVPGVPAGVRHLWERWGSLPWADLVEPALLASYGTPFPLAHAELLPHVSSAMLAGEGADVFARRDGSPLQAGDPLLHREHWRAFELLRDDPDAFYTGSYAEAALSVLPGALDAEDLAGYRVREHEPRVLALPDGRTVHARGDDLDDTLGTLGQVVTAGATGDATTDPSVALELVAALRAHPKLGDTTNVVAVDHVGNALVATTSLGLGSAVYVPGFGVHLNSMLGEGELIRDAHRPGNRVNSMMSPLVVLDAQGRLELAAGAAGGSRIRSALVQTTAAMLAEVDPQTAIDRPRLAALSDEVRLEPGFASDVVAALGAAGHRVATTESQLPFFGGVSAVGRHGAGADPRRSGEAISLH